MRYPLSHIVARNGLQRHIYYGIFYQITAHCSSALAATVVVIGFACLGCSTHSRHWHTAFRAVEFAGKRKLFRRIYLAARAVPVVKDAFYHVLFYLRPKTRHPTFYHMTGIAICSAVLHPSQKLSHLVLVEGLSIACLLTFERPHDIGYRMAGKQHVLHLAHKRRFALIDAITTVYDIPTV